MKKCNACGVLVDDQSNVCPMCGSTDFAETTAPQPTQPAEAPQPVSVEEQGNGNILAGIVGAFLFSIIGGLLYFVIYQAGIIAGICGLVIFVLANFGYGLFARTKNKSSVAGLIVSILATIVMIFVAEYVCIAYEVYVVYKEYFDLTIFDAIKITPEILAEPEVRAGVLKDLAFAYIFGFAASIGNIVNLVKARKQK